MVIFNQTKCFPKSNSQETLKNKWINQGETGSWPAIYILKMEERRVASSITNNIFFSTHTNCCIFKFERPTKTKKVLVAFLLSMNNYRCLYNWSKRGSTAVYLSLAKPSFFSSSNTNRAPAWVNVVVTAVVCPQAFHCKKCRSLPPV